MQAKTEHRQRRSFFKAAGGLALAALVGTASNGALAQVTDKAIRFILPNATGSGVDTLARGAQNALAKTLGHPIVIDNQPGAGGIVGTQQLVKSAPDGFTLSIVSNNHVINPAVYKNVPYDAVTDFTPIAVIGYTPVVLVVNPNKVQAKNVQELVAAMKANPNGFNLASSGTGTILHLAGELFLEEAGVKATHVPYKGVGPMVTDLIGGQVELGFTALPSVQQHIKNGSLRVLGVGSTKRLAAAPEIPTIAEQGVPKYAVEAWLAMIGPAKMPPAEVKRINAAVAAAFATPEVREANAKQGNTLDVSTPEYAAQFIRTEREKYAKLVKQAGIEPQ